MSPGLGNFIVFQEFMLRFHVSFSGAVDWIVCGNLLAGYDRCLAEKWNVVCKGCGIIGVGAHQGPCWVPASIFLPSEFLSKIQDVQGEDILKQGSELGWYMTLSSEEKGKPSHLSCLGTMKWMFPKIGVPTNHPFNRVFHYKPSILGYPYFWKHPNF